MTDENYKECTAQVKAMADIRPLAIDDVDSILRAFYRHLKTAKKEPLLPNLTLEEQKKLAMSNPEFAAAKVLSE